jgi:hypothetical protein
MGILSKLNPLAPIFEEIGKTVRQAIPDPNKRLEVEAKLKEYENQAHERMHQELLGQIEVNKVEAAHRSVFVAGWRPGLGWVGVAGAAVAFVAIPLTTTFNSLIDGRGIPEYDIGQLMVLVTGMLGLSINRTVDKVKGVASDAPLGKPVVETQQTTTVSGPPVDQVAPLADMNAANRDQFDFARGE